MAGIAIGRDQVCAVVFGEKGGKHEAPVINTQRMPVTLFAAKPTLEIEAMLADALLAVSGEFRGMYASVHVALPDTVIRSKVFELDELPKTAGMREALLRWRFAKEWQRSEDTLECCGFDLGQDRGKRLYFGQGADRQWLDCVRRALARAGLTPWSLNAATTYRFNCFHDVMAGAGGALLSLEPDCWSLLLWDGSRRVRHVLTRLRENLAAENEAVSIAEEVERAVLAYVKDDGRRSMGRLYLAGSNAEMAALAGVFDGRLSERTVSLHADEKISVTSAGMRDGLAPLALAAALST